MAALTWLLMIACISNSALHELHYTQESTPRNELDQKLRRLVAVSEIHAICINQPAVSRFSETEILDWIVLVNALRNEEGPGPRIRDAMWKPTIEALKDDDAVSKLTNRPSNFGVAKLKSLVFAGLSMALYKPNLYDAKKFKGITLNSDMKRFLEKGGTHIDVIRFNRALLTAAFPKAVAPLTSPKDYHVSRVKVQRGKSVVLILSSYHPCRWELDIEEGASVACVVLCGYHSQEMVGAAVPTLHRVHFLPDGVKWTRDFFYYPFSEDEDAYNSFRLGIEDLLGRKWDKIQENKIAPKAGFVVTPAK